MSEPAAFHRYAALGDSLTEGLCDPAPQDGGSGTGNPWRGWADRVAENLAVAAATAGRPFEYANLAVRGRLLTEVIEEQVPAALRLQPDLVSIIGGGNDLLRVGADVDAITTRLDRAVGELRAGGTTVLLATAYDTRSMALVRRVRGMAGVFSANIWTIARKHDALVLDLWGMTSLYHPLLWAPDRIHLVDEGHRRVALHALQVLGRPTDGDWATALPARPPRSRQQAIREDAAWVRGHVAPWIGRRLRGQSSGDGLEPKRPVPTPLLPTPPTPPP
jgi:lysophospholipase L1-like esterase